MLEIAGLTLRGRRAPRPETPLKEIHARMKPGTVCGMVAPPGSGGSAFLETLAGLRMPDLGSVTLKAAPPAPARLLSPEDVAWVPDAAVLSPALSARAHLSRSASLIGLAGRAKRERVDGVLAELGLSELADRSLRSAGAGAARLAAVGCTLLSRPKVIVADRLLDGLAPGEEALVLGAFPALAAEGRIAIVRLGAPRLLSRFDTALVLHGGHVVFHGAPGFLCHYFSIEENDGLFVRLAGRAPEDWHRSWVKHGTPYENNTIEIPAKTPPIRIGQASSSPGAPLAPLPAPAEEEEEVFFRKPEPPPTPAPEVAGEPSDPGGDEGEGSPARPPGAVAQALMAFSDRAAVLARTPRALAWVVAGLAAILSLGIYPALGGPGGLPVRGGHPEAALLAGLSALLVALASLFGVALGAAEGTVPRDVARWSRRIGWSASGWIGGRAVLVAAGSGLGGLLLAGAAGSLPGMTASLPLLLATGLLTGLAAGMLGLLVGAASPCRGMAALLAPLAVLVQLPLAGVILATPRIGELILRPLCAVYWGWMGGVSAFSATPGGAAMKEVVPGWLAHSWVWSWAFLAGHILLGFSLAVAAFRAKSAPR